MKRSMIAPAAALVFVMAAFNAAAAKDEITTDFQATTAVQNPNKEMTVYDAAEEALETSIHAGEKKPHREREKVEGWAEKGGAAIPAAGEIKFLDPEMVDHAFDDLIGRRIAPIVRDNKLAVQQVPYCDDALDQFGKYSPFDFELGFTLTSKYMWRGQDLTPPRACWQPYVRVSPDFEPIGNFCFTYWTNIASGYPTDDTEHDFYLDYNLDMLDLLKTVGVKKDTMPYLVRKALDFNLAAGWGYFFYPPSGACTDEVYGTVTYNWPFHPYVFFTNDYRLGNGVWCETGISESFDLKLFILNYYTKIGYNHRQWSVSSKLQTLELGFSMPLPLGKHMKIEPFLAYSKRLNKTYYTTANEDGSSDWHIRTRDNFFGGFKYVINF